MNDNKLLAVKICTKCKESKFLTDFRYCRSTKDNKQSWCKLCCDLAKQEAKWASGVKRRKAKVNTDTHRECTKCNKILELVNYCKGHSWCNQCKKDREQNIRLANGIVKKKVPIVEKNRKQCLHCNQIKDLDLFRNCKRGRLGKASYCKECDKILLSIRKIEDKDYHKKQYSYIKKSRERDRDKYLLEHRKHQAKRRASKYATQIDGDITNEFIYTLYNTEICYYCKLIIDYDSRTMEHKLPLSRGGSHTKDNLVMACGSCNFSKHDKTEEEFKLYKEKLNEYRRINESGDTS